MQKETKLAIGVAVCFVVLLSYSLKDTAQQQEVLPSRKDAEKAGHASSKQPLHLSLDPECQRALDTLAIIETRLKYGNLSDQERALISERAIRIGAPLAAGRLRSQIAAEVARAIDAGEQLTDERAFYRLFWQWRGIAALRARDEVAGREAALVLEKVGGQNRFLPDLYKALNALRASGWVSLDPEGASKDDPFVNTLGMEFVPVPATKTLFCRTETRVQDFGRFVGETGYNLRGLGAYGVDNKLDKEVWWNQPGFDQDTNHPVTCVSIKDAEAFCEWLSKREQRLYRCPTDFEWSMAVGDGTYPWGDAWPPPFGAGNYAGEERSKDNAINAVPIIEGYEDGMVITAPVGIYTENKLGMFDLGGNVFEWCEDEYRANLNSADDRQKVPALEKEVATDGTPYRIVRGGAWDSLRFFARSSVRSRFSPNSRDVRVGFRVVLVLPSSSDAN